MNINSAPTAVIECRDVSRSYRQGSTDVQVLDNLSCTIGEGELVAIVGASGSGKSTLLNLMGGLDDADHGTVSVVGTQIKHLSESHRAALRNSNLGFVYQFHHLLGEFSALENVAIPCLIGGAKKQEAEAIALELLTRVGLKDRVHHRPAALSGGERQRVAIARALATRPACVLMDEPTGNLDPATAGGVFELLMELNREYRISFVIVTHDMALASRMDRILQLQNGRLVEVEPTHA